MTSLPIASAYIAGHRKRIVVLLNKIGFKNYKSDLRPTGPGDNHRQWIWVQVEK